MINFEFFEHKGHTVTVEMSRLERVTGGVWVAALLDDPEVRFEAEEREEALAKLRRHVLGEAEPATEAAGTSAQATVPAAPAGPLVLDRPAQVLVVDDNPNSAHIVMNICEMCGHSAVFARDGNEALAWLNSRPFDLVLTDLHMPGLGGLRLVQLLRASERGQRLPIIAVTAAGPNNLRALDALGVQGVVNKPYEVRDLMAAINRVVTRAS